MNEIDDGGAAFPRDDFHRGIPGMSMRDWFAGQALVGMLAHSTRYKPLDGRADWHSAIAEEAVQLAAAMIAVRTAFASKPAPDPAPAPMFGLGDFFGKYGRSNS